MPRLVARVALRTLEQRELGALAFHVGRRQRRLRIGVQRQAAAVADHVAQQRVELGVPGAPSRAGQIRDRRVDIVLPRTDQTVPTGGAYS